MRSVTERRRLHALYRAYGNEGAGCLQDCPRPNFAAVFCYSMLGFRRVISPPAGGAGGSELSGRSRPGASAEGRGRTGASGGRVGGAHFPHGIIK